MDHCNIRINPPAVVNIVNIEKNLLAWSCDFISFRIKVGDIDIKNSTTRVPSTINNMVIAAVVLKNLWCPQVLEVAFIKVVKLSKANEVISLIKATGTDNIVIIADLLLEAVTQTTNLIKASYFFPLN